MKFTAYIVLLLALSSAASSQGFEPIKLSTLQVGENIDHSLSYQIDDSLKLTLDDVLQNSWQTNQQDKISMGYSQANHWFYTILENDSFLTLHYLLAVEYPVLDYVDVYIKDQSGEWQSFNFGDKQPFAERIIEHRYFLAPVEFSPHEKIEFVFRVKSTSAIQFPLTIWKHDEFYIQDIQNVFGQGLFFGLMLVMVLYNLFVFFSVRDTSYLYYVIYVAANTTFFGSLKGFNFQFLWPNATSWNDYSIATLLTIMAIFTLLFTKRFLRLSQSRSLLNTANILIFASFITLATIPFIAFQTIIQIVIILILCVIIFAAVSGGMRLKQGFLPARFFVLSWFSIFLGGILMGFAKFNLIENSFIVENMLQIGTALEVVLLSFALADRMNLEKARRAEAQQSLHEQELKTLKAKDVALQFEREARIAQTRALEIQKQATELLEQRVKERTQELEEANQKLEKLSTTDALTGLFNRRLLEQQLNYEIERAMREKSAISVLMIDIDFFKKINDNFGHQIGDEALKIVAKIIREFAQRNTDCAARYGGEEFVLTLPNTPSKDALYIAEQLREKIENLDLSIIHPELNITLSIGVYGGVPEHKNDAEKWLKLADQALYQAKENGRNQVVSA